MLPWLLWLAGWWLQHQHMLSGLPAAQLQDARSPLQQQELADTLASRPACVHLPLQRWPLRRAHEPPWPPQRHARQRRGLLPQLRPRLPGLGGAAPHQPGPTDSMPCRASHAEQWFCASQVLCPSWCPWRPAPPPSCLALGPGPGTGRPRLYASRQAGKHRDGSETEGMRNFGSDSARLGAVPRQAGRRCKQRQGAPRAAVCPGRLPPIQGSPDASQGSGGKPLPPPNKSSGTPPAPGALSSFSTSSSFRLYTSASSRGTPAFCARALHTQASRGGQ